MLFKECVEGKNNLCAAGVLGAIVSYNVLRLQVVGVWNTQLSIPTNVYLKIQMFVSKAKRK
jgi:hypothetical protein